MDQAGFCVRLSSSIGVTPEDCYLGHETQKIGVEKEFSVKAVCQGRDLETNDACALFKLPCSVTFLM